MEGSVADLKSATDPSIISLSEEGVTHRNVGDYHCHLSRHPFVSQVKYIVQKEDRREEVFDSFIKQTTCLFERGLKTVLLAMHVELRQEISCPCLLTLKVKNILLCICDVSHYYLLYWMIAMTTMTVI